MPTSTRISQPFALPRDTIVRYPCLTHGMAELIAFDADGEPRMKVEVAADRVQDVEERMLRWTRENYPPHVHLVG
jgi:hypothetical protein